MERFHCLTFYNIFPVSSLTNLSLIVLERLHAALYPFRYCLIEKWAYYKITIGSWLLALLLASVMAVLNYYVPAVNRYAWTLYIVLTLLILAISYVVIIVNVKRNPPPQALGLVASDRKLSVTLFIVTIVSMLSILPNLIYEGIWNQLTDTIQFSITYTFTALYYTGALVNPFIYVVRMREFRESVKDLLYKKLNVIELRAM